MKQANYIRGFKTKAQVKQFFKAMDNLGVTWKDGEDLLGETGQSLIKESKVSDLAFSLSHDMSYFEIRDEEVSSVRALLYGGYEIKYFNFNKTTMKKLGTLVHDKNPAKVINEKLREKAHQEMQKSIDRVVEKLKKQRDRKIKEEGRFSWGKLWENTILFVMTYVLSNIILTVLSASRAMAYGIPGNTTYDHIGALIVAIVVLLTHKK